ncbi:hypothetical protein EON82_01125 [bacterium]|nr:MAG: hypothetical protein EON82_01125 [bacterium]
MATAFASLALVGCPGRSGGDNLATVNNEPISMDEFHRYLERKPVVQVVDSETGQQKELPVYASLGFQAMRDLVNRRILLQLAKDDNVFPTDADVKAELDFQVKRRPDFIRALQNQGLTIEDIRRDLTLDLAKERIITKGITVTTADAEKYIKENPKAFETPPQAKLRIIVVRDDSAKKQVDADLASGKPFSQVAMQYSVAPNVRQTQGEFPVKDVSRMPKALQDIVAATPELKATDWKRDGQQWVKIFVEQKVAAKPMTIDDTLKESLRRQMAMERGSKATDLGKRLVDKLKTSTVAVTLPSLKTPWETAFKSLQEQDVQANTGTSATPGTTPGAATTGGAPR